MGQKVHISWDGHVEDYGVLYAYLEPEQRDILYIGKADRSSVRQRFYGDHKKAVFNHYAGDTPDVPVEVIVGRMLLDDGRRFSSDLLSDIESLLIFRLRPPLNIQNTASRGSYYRPNMVVTCSDGWPEHVRSRFIDR